MNKIFENFNLNNVNWIASHPIAGTEESGPSAGLKDLLKIDGQLFVMEKTQTQIKLKN